MEPWLRNKVSSEIKVYEDSGLERASAQIKSRHIRNMSEHLEEKLTMDTEWLLEERVHRCTASLVVLTVEEYRRLHKKLEAQEELLYLYKHLPF